MAYFKTKRFLLVLFLSLTLALGCIAVMQSTTTAGQWRIFRQRTLPAGYFESPEQEPAATAEATDATQADDVWTVRAHDERIGVFDADDKLQYVVDVYLFTLPQADQTLLRQGITVRSEHELAALMEDYTG